MLMASLPGVLSVSLSFAHASLMVRTAGTPASGDWAVTVSVLPNSKAHAAMGMMAARSSSERDRVMSRVAHLLRGLMVRPGSSHTQWVAVIQQHPSELRQVLIER